MAVKKRILLVDDDQFLRDELTEQFGLYDEFETTAAANGADGLAAAKEQAFDLIILDVDMPDMQGTEVCALMRFWGLILARMIMSPSPFALGFCSRVCGRICVALSNPKMRFSRSGLMPLNLPINVSPHLKLRASALCAIFA